MRFFHPVAGARVRALVPLFFHLVHLVYFGSNEKLITNSVPGAALELPKVILVKKDYCTPRTSGLFIRVISSLEPRTARVNASAGAAAFAAGDL